VSICGRCDRGNIFCAKQCAALSRRQSLRRAGARYQRAHRGARHHAARQRAWRERQLEKVTHLGCASTGTLFTMSITVDMAALELTDAPSAPHRPLEAPGKAPCSPQRITGRCDFCHAPLPLFTRLRTWRGWGFG